jgi:hypothetical protein
MTSFNLDLLNCYELNLDQQNIWLWRTAKTLEYERKLRRNGNYEHMAVFDYSH